MRWDHALRNHGKPDARFHGNQLCMKVGTVEYDLISDAVLGERADHPIVAGPCENRKRRPWAENEVFCAHPCQRIVEITDDQLVYVFLDCRIFKQTGYVDI